MNCKRIELMLFGFKLVFELRKVEKVTVNIAPHAEIDLSNIKRRLAALKAED